MTRRQPLPQRFSGVPFAVGAALDADVPEGRLRAGDLAKPFHGVRTPQPPSDVVALARAYATLLPAHHFFSHITAALLLGMRWPWLVAPSPLHVTAIADRAPRGAGIRGHRTDRAVATTDVQGLRVATAVETWIACAAMLTVTQLVILGDGLLARFGAITDPASLRALLVDRPGIRGRRKLEAALELMRAGTDSAKETELRLLLRSAGLPEPEVNGVIRDAAGRVRFHGDLVFRHQRVIVEYDGRHHATDGDQWSIDVDRINALTALGWRVVRVNAALLRQPAKLITMLTQLLSA